MDASDGDPRSKPGWTRRDTIRFVLITTVAAALRLFGLGTPSTKIFDERFYAPDACWYVRPGSNACGIALEINLEHPPLGKWLIAAGEAALGHDPLGWRISSAIVGVATVALLYLFAKKLLRSTFAATFATSLLAVDFLHLVQSRVAMLDVFIGFFICAAFVALIFDRDHLLTGRAGVRARPWRLAAGALAGAAVATKWSGVFALVALFVTLVAWEVWARPGPRRAAVVDLLRRDGAVLLLAFVVVPLVLYTLTHVGRVQGELLALPSTGDSWAGAFIDRQQEAYSFHVENSAVNPFASPPWSWLLLKRAVPMHFDVSDEGLYRQVTSTGNPVVWWLSIPALLYVTAVWFRYNSPRRPEGVIVAGFWWNYLPWLAFAAAPFLLGSSRSSLFIFYVLPMLPFMFLGMASIASRLVATAWGKGIVAAFTAAVAASFVFYYPLLTNRPLEPEQWRRRVALFNDCARPEQAPIVVVSLATSNGTTSTVRKSFGREALPPVGWCWIQIDHGDTRIDFRSLRGEDPAG